MANDSNPNPTNMCYIHYSTSGFHLLLSANSTKTPHSRNLLCFVRSSQTAVSSRSVRQFYFREGIRYRNVLPDPVLDRIRTIDVGHSYGRRTMTGLLPSQGIVVGETGLQGQCEGYLQLHTLDNDRRLGDTLILLLT